MCVYATADAKQPMAIIIPHEAHLRHYLESVSGVDAKAGLASLCHTKKVQELVLKECNALGKKNGFKTMELLQAVVLTPDEWTPESGLVTAAQKIQRNAIAKKFDKEIKVSACPLGISSLLISHCTGCLQAIIDVLLLSRFLALAFMISVSSVAVCLFIIRLYNICFDMDRTIWSHRCR